MPNPYRARVDVRRFLNLPGFHGGAYVVAYVEDTSSRELTKRDPFGYKGNRYGNPQPRIILEIADCSERINLEFELHSALDVENSLHKIDVLVAALAEFRAGLVEEARLYREREPEVERRNRTAPEPRPRRRRRRARTARGAVYRLLDRRARRRVSYTYRLQVLHFDGTHGAAASVSVRAGP